MILVEKKGANLKRHKKSYPDKNSIDSLIIRTASNQSQRVPEKRQRFDFPRKNHPIHKIRMEIHTFTSIFPQGDFSHTRAHIEYAHGIFSGRLRGFSGVFFSKSGKIVEVQISGFYNRTEFGTGFFLEFFDRGIFIFDVSIVRKKPSFCSSPINSVFG